MSMEQNIQVNGKTVYLKISPYNAKLGIGSYKRKLVKALERIGITEEYIDSQRLLNSKDNPVFPRRCCGLHF